MATNLLSALEREMDEETNVNVDRQALPPAAVGQNLARYETAQQKTFYRAIAELRRIQGARSGGTAGG